MNAAEGAPPLRPWHGHWLTACIAVTLLPHVEHLPIWLSASCALLLAWRALADRSLTPLPGRALLLFVAAAIVAATGIEFHHLLGKDPGLALLAGFACLKLLEARSLRDGRAAVLLGFFLQMGQFLNGQEISVAALTLCGTLLAVGTLLAMECEAPWQTVIAGAGRLLFMAAPFMLALFVLFPRIPGPLWGLPADAFSGLTGLSETMSPGSISRLIQSGKIAFRAEFDGEIPPPRDRYWRGPVLCVFDGRRWEAGFTTLSSSPPYEVSGKAYRYRLTVEPHNQHWLLAMDFPAADDPRTRYSSDLRLVSVAPLRSRQRYELAAYPAARAGQREFTHVIRRNLRLPEGSNPRTTALGRQVAERFEPPRHRIEALLGTFRELRLEYTLTPRALGLHSADEFLFDTREGFCEHFSSAFAIAARAAGIPARVVTGYQGGEINPHDGSLVVRQSDAHAWVEVWLPESGWQRVDPTATSNPTRIDNGILGALPDIESLPLFMQPRMAWLRSLQLRWDAVANGWNQWVLGYNDERQRSLLRGLGFDGGDYRHLAAAMVTLVGTLMLGFVTWSLRRRRRGDALDRRWQRFCARLSRAGTRRADWQGPLDFADLAAARHPSLADDIRWIGGRYAELRYGRKPPSRQDLADLDDRIKHLDIR